MKTPALAPRPAQTLPAVLCVQVDGGRWHQALAFPAVSHPLTLAHTVSSSPGSSKTEAREREKVTSVPSLAGEKAAVVLFPHSSPS